MSDLWQSLHQRDGVNGVVSLVLRFLGATFFGYLLWAQGAFTGPVWVAVLTGLALLLGYVRLLDAVLRPERDLVRPVSLVLTVTMMVAGAVVNPHVAYLGSVFVVVGGISVIGHPALPLRVGIPLVLLVAVVQVVSAGLRNPSTEVLLSNAFAALAVALLGLNRRNQTIRQQQERELAVRSAELAERNAELEVQTEQTRRETARAAALEERGRIARDLHDVLAHSLGGLVVQLDAVEAELAQGRTPAATARLHASRQLAVEGLREARSAVAKLRTDDLDPTAGEEPVDLVAAVTAVARGPVGLHLGVELDVVGTPRPVRRVQADALVAVVREALTNVNKHAPGSNVSATVLFGPDDVRVEVVNALAGGAAVGPLAQTGGGAGLAGLAERMSAVGGQFGAGVEGRRWVVGAGAR